MSLNSEPNAWKNWPEKQACATLEPRQEIATDKLLALIGQTPPSVGVVIMPSETDREERRAIHARLDAIARRLAGNAGPAVPLSLPAGS
jgi:hypothetical protein